MENAKIGIVTVLYKSEAVVEDFFRTLNEQSYKNFILYIIDNKSPDSSLDKSKELAKFVWFETKFIENDDNYGVAKGNNQGIEAALKDECDFVLLSNNDVVLRTDTIEKLYIGLIKNNADMAVPKIYFYNTKIIWSAGGKFRWFLNIGLHIGGGKKDKKRYNKNYFITYAPTCFMLIKKDIFSIVGVIDEKYFVYGDDSDFIYRAVKKLKRKLIYIYDSEVEHKEGVSTGGPLSDFFCHYVYRNRIYFAKKHNNFFFFYFFLELLFHYTIRRVKLKNYKHQWQVIKSAFFTGLRY